MSALLLTVLLGGLLAPRITAYDLPAQYATWPVNARSVAKPQGHPIPLGSKVCVTFSQGTRVTYTVRDVCPAGNWDIHVRKVTSRVRRDIARATISEGRCHGYH